ncbi:MAG: hypothetical protein ACHRHE_00845 [Tepidisphaerales bacterium]
MRQRANRLTVLTLAAVSVAFVGCDGPQTQRDKEIKENIRKAQQTLAEKGPTTQAAAQAAVQAAAFHEAAAKVQGASLASSIDAKMFVAGDNYNRAVAMLGDLDDSESAATLALRTIQSAADAIARNNVQIKILAAADPAEVGKAMEKAKAEQAAQSAASAELLKKTQGDAAAREARIKETQSKLAAATDEMNQLFQKSELARGQESVDLYNKAIAVRQTVQKTSHELAQQQLELSRLQRTAAEAAAAQQTADASVVATQKSLEQTAVAWTETQKAIAARNDENKNIMESQIAPQAKQFADAMKEAAKVRKEIEQRLDKTIAAYRDARKDAGTLQSDFLKWNDAANAQNPSMAARQSEANTHDPNWYLMLEAKAVLAKGMLSLNLVQLLDRQNLLLEKDLKPILLDAKLMAPADLMTSDLTSQLADSRKQAEALLNDADGVFAPAMESNIPALAKESRMLRVASQYALYALKDFKSAPNLQTAQRALEDFANTGLPIPRFPAQLEAVLQTGKNKRTGPVGQAPPTTVIPRTPDKTPATPDGTAPTPPTPTTPGPAIPAIPGVGIGLPDLSGLTNIIPGMKKKDGGGTKTPATPTTPSTPATPTPEIKAPDAAASPAGRYVSKMGDPAGRTLAIVQVMELKADGTATFTRTTHNAGRPGSKAEKIADGRWTVEGETVTIVLEKSRDGSAIAPEEAKRTFTLNAATKKLSTQGLDLTREE